MGDIHKSIPADKELVRSFFLQEILHDDSRTFEKTIIIRDVIIPQSYGTILEMLSYFFVNSMMTISAVSFLATVRTKPVALMITQFEGQMQLECAAFVSLLILAVNVIMKLLVHHLKKHVYLT